MSPLCQQMIEDMKLAGLSPATQDAYIKAVRGLAAHYHRSPDQLSEEEVRSYLLGMRERGVARGTFTLDRDWALFSKKKIRQPKQKWLPNPVRRAAHEISRDSDSFAVLADRVQAAIENFAKMRRDLKPQFSPEDLNDGQNGHAGVLKLFDDYLATSY
jgi:Phage integrase, N-terminal SAM-like domain